MSEALQFEEPSTGESELRRVLKLLLPDAVNDWVADFLAVGSGYRALFLRLQLWRALRRPCVRDFSSIRSIVFVCHGNILRSPMAERLLRKELETGGIDQIRVASAGVHARDGGAADERGCISALDYGVSLTSHRARVLTAEIVAAADTIVVMDRRNETSVIGRFPDAGPKLILLGCFLPGGGHYGMFIGDPYSGTIDDVRRCYRTIAMAVDEFAKRIRQTHPMRALDAIAVRPERTPGPLPLHHD